MKSSSESIVWVGERISVFLEVDFVTPAAVEEGEGSVWVLRLVVVAAAAAALCCLVPDAAALTRSFPVLSLSPWADSAAFLFLVKGGVMKKSEGFEILQPIR